MQISSMVRTCRNQSDTGKNASMPCPQCGWPGVGKMPAGVRLVKQNDKRVLIGQLTYFVTDALLCSVCEEMKTAVKVRPWFVKAHGEYVTQVKVKKQMLEGK